MRKPTAALASESPATRGMQRAWLQLVRCRWSSLAIVSTCPGVSGRSLLDAAKETAQFFDLGAIRLIDAEGASLTEGARHAEEAAAAVKAGGRVLVAIDSPVLSAGSIPLVIWADAAILLVRLGESDFRSVRAIVDLVGRERVLGCMTAQGPALGRS